jgi:hypothetical protein
MVAIYTGTAKSGRWRVEADAVAYKEQQEAHVSLVRQGNSLQNTHSVKSEWRLLPLAPSAGDMAGSEFHEMPFRARARRSVPHRRQQGHGECLN